MPDINIDTDSIQYRQLLSGLDTLRTVLASRIEILIQLPRDKQLVWLAHDPLLRRTIRLAQTLDKVLELEVQE